MIVNSFAPPQMESFRALEAETLMKGDALLETPGAELFLIRLKGCFFLPDTFPLNAVFPKQSGLYAKWCNLSHRSPITHFLVPDTVISSGFFLVIFCPFFFNIPASEDKLRSYGQKKLMSIMNLLYYQIILNYEPNLSKLFQIW